jgi:hypothetical protein
MWYMDVENTIVEGPVEVHGDVMRMSWRICRC